MSEVAPEVPAQPVAEAPAVEATPVEQQQPSNAAADEQKSFVAEVEEKVVDIFEAAKRLVGLVEQHRTIGDAEVSAAAADVKAAVEANAPAVAAESDAAQA